jgi:hypothetical protein
MSIPAVGPTRIQWVLGFFLEIKWPGHEVDHSPPSNAKVNELSYTTILPICLHGMDMDNFFTMK